MVDERFEPRCERATSNVAAPPELLELTHSQVDIPDDREYPAIADHGHSLCDLTIEDQVGVNFLCSFSGHCSHEFDAGACVAASRQFC
jgi:hypothetical protein